MASIEESVKVGDIVRELSLDTLTYLSGLRLLRGKFVRLGELIVVGPEGIEVEIGPFRGRLTHHDLMAHGRHSMGEEFANRIEATKPKNGGYLHEGWSLVDAGHFLIKVYSNGGPEQLTLSGESIDYGRPGELIRQTTGELAQSALGPDVLVEVDVPRA
jgi:hypothetical protein